MRGVEHREKPPGTRSRAPPVSSPPWEGLWAVGAPVGSSAQLSEECPSERGVATLTLSPGPRFSGLEGAPLDLCHSADTVIVRDT